MSRQARYYPPMRRGRRADVLDALRTEVHAVRTSASAATTRPIAAYAHPATTTVSTAAERARRTRTTLLKFQ